LVLPLATLPESRPLLCSALIPHGPPLFVALLPVIVTPEAPSTSMPTFEFPGAQLPVTLSPLAKPTKMPPVEPTATSPLTVTLAQTITSIAPLALLSERTLCTVPLAPESRWTPSAKVVISPFSITTPVWPLL
jgi:hypothetical protein